MKTNVILITILSIAFSCYTYSNELNQTEKNKYYSWLQDMKIPEDKEIVDSENARFIFPALFEAESRSRISIQTALDVPIDSSNDSMLVKVYFAPVFINDRSIFYNSDSIPDRVDLLFFNLAELASRRTRKRIDSILTYKNKAYSVLKDNFVQIKEDAENDFMIISSNLNYDLFIRKEPTAFDRWNTIVAALLKKTEKWATKPEDIQRFLSNKPLFENYRQSSLPNNKEGN